MTGKRESEEIRYHIACMSDKNGKFVYNEADCFNIKVPDIGAAKAVYYDVAAFSYCLRYIKKYNIKKPIVYVLACRIGPFVGTMKKELQKYGGKLYVNPDGHEWKRSKWNTLIKKYWKISEKLMVKNADLLVCDSVNIEKYIRREYRQYRPKTTYIAYGAEMSRSTLGDDDKKFVKWCRKKNVKPLDYYLVVGRFVPENNYETMITEFMRSHTKKDFVLITNIEKNNKF